MSGRDTGPAPLYTRSHDLARWLLAHLPGTAPLTERIQRGALDLLDALVLALEGRRRPERLDAADEALLLLRAHLRLGHDAGLLDAERLMFLAAQLDDIGRQLGGWRKHLERRSVEPRHR